MSPELTPSQTVGPFFHDALVDEDRSKLVTTSHPSAVRIEGTVYDRAGEPVPDAMVETWQANLSGRYDDPTDDWYDLPFSLAAKCCPTLTRSLELCSYRSNEIP